MFLVEKENGENGGEKGLLFKDGVVFLLFFKEVDEVIFLAFSKEVIQKRVGKKFKR